MRGVALIGVVGVALSYLVGYLGMNWTTASDAALVISAEPLFTVMLAVVFLSEPLGWRRAGALALGMAGAYIIVGMAARRACCCPVRQAIGQPAGGRLFAWRSRLYRVGKAYYAYQSPSCDDLYAIWIGAAVLLPVTLVFHLLACRTPRETGQPACSPHRGRRGWPWSTSAQAARSALIYSGILH